MPASNRRRSFVAAKIATNFCDLLLSVFVFSTAKTCRKEEVSGPHNPSQKRFHVECRDQDLLTKLRNLKNVEESSVQTAMNFLRPPEDVKTVIFAMRRGPKYGRTRKEGKKLFEKWDSRRELT